MTIGLQAVIINDAEFKLMIHCVFSDEILEDHCDYFFLKVHLWPFHAFILIEKVGREREGDTCSK